MKSTHLLRAISIASLLSTAITAQSPDPVPLKPWYAPPFWQPTVAEEKAQTERLASAAKTGEMDRAAATATLSFIGVTPCRVVDTRPSGGFTGPFGPPTIPLGGTRTFPIPSSSCGIPSTAQAYSFNITVVPPGPLAFITVWPTGEPRPNASTLNAFQGFIVANAAIVPAGTAGAIDLFASNATDVVIDINGYYVAGVASGGTILPAGSANAPALSFTNNPGTGVFSSGAGTLDLAAGGVDALRVDSTGLVTTTGGINTNGPLNMIFDPVVPTEFPGSADAKGADRNAILVGGAPPCLSTRSWMTNGMFACQDTDFMYVGLKQEPLGAGDRRDAVIAWGDNPAGDAPKGPDVLRMIFTGRTALAPAVEGTLGGREVARFLPDGSVGIGTTTPFSRLTVSDTLNPAISVSTAAGGGQLAVASSAGNYSNFATAGDVVVRTVAGPSEDLILTTRNANGGAIRFGTGTTVTEAERASIDANGLVGIGTAAATSSNVLLDVNGMVRVENLSGTGTKMVTADASGVLHSANLPTGGGNVSGICFTTNILPKWTSANTAGCSQILDDGTNVLVANTTGFTSAINNTYLPAKMEIKDLSSNSVGANGLRLTNIGVANGGFAEAGLVFSPGVSGFQYDGGRIYAKFNSQSAPHGGRLTLQSVQGTLVNGAMVDTLHVTNGKVGVGATATSPLADLDVNGNARIATVPLGQSSTTVCLGTNNILEKCGASDVRLKKNIVPLAGVLEKLTRIRGVTFDWNETAKPLVIANGKREIGVIAQEVESEFPELVNDQPEGFKTVSYDKLTAVLLEGIKELKSENESLKARLEALEKLVLR